MKIAFDIAALDPEFKAHASRGIGRYVRELSRYFSENPLDDIAIDYFNSFSLVRDAHASRLIDVFPFGRVTLRQQCLAPFLLRSLEAMIHFPAHIDAPAWSRAPYMVTVLDLIPMIFKDLYKADKPSWRFHLARALECKSIQHARLVLAISECTARDVHNLLDIPEERIVVTPLGVDDAFFSCERAQAQTAIRERLGLPLDRQIVLYVGGIDQRKNIAGLISGFGLARTRQIEARREPPILVLAGGIQSDGEFTKLQRWIEEEGLGRSVVCTGYLTDEELLSLFSIAAVFYFPSFYEGFGLPPLEAMAAGVPVVSSDRSSMPEVLGDAALLIDPERTSDASEAILSILNDTEAAGNLSTKGRARAKLFSWERTGKQTLEAYRRALRSDVMRKHERLCGERFNA